VVLDDDPTGPQAMQDVFVLTHWDVEALRREFMQPRPLFFVLTNTRALSQADAIARHNVVATNLQLASAQSGVAYDIVSRGDSTLRGHYPDELAPLGAFDATILAPFFEEGGRFTIDDVQWVRQGQWLVPAAQTAYARDSTFGYAYSNLRNWVEEKSRGHIRAEDVLSLSLDQLRRGGPLEVQRALSLARRQTIILNSASYHDLEVFTVALLSAEVAGQRFLVRSAASFLRVRAGQADVGDANGWKPTNPQGKTTAGLVIVGSHVPRSNAQLERLMREPNTLGCELDVAAVVKGHASREIERVTYWLNRHAQRAACLAIYTSRERIDGAGQGALKVGATLSAALADIVRRLEFSPPYFVVKGGWTASVVGTEALGVRRAYAPAPILPGIPLWILGNETPFPQVPYVIFPGNVGDDDALVAVVRVLTT
jgi:uncharacterized protein YgbK (DUF1537 family)